MVAIVLQGTQAPPQSVSPAPQSWPQAPQLAASTAVSKQAPPQIDSPAGQVISLAQPETRVIAASAAARSNERFMGFLDWGECPRGG